jgi:ribonuclease G
VQQLPGPRQAEDPGNHLLRDLPRNLCEARAYQAEGYRVLANQKVVDRLLDEESGNVAELEGFIGRTIRFQVETMYSQEQYDVVLL